MWTRAPWPVGVCTQRLLFLILVALKKLSLASTCLKFRVQLFKTRGKLSGLYLFRKNKYFQLPWHLNSIFFSCQFPFPITLPWINTDCAIIFITKGFSGPMVVLGILLGIQCAVQLSPQPRCESTQTQQIVSRGNSSPPSTLQPLGRQLGLELACLKIRFSDRDR